VELVAGLALLAWSVGMFTIGFLAGAERPCLRRHVDTERSGDCRCAANPAMFSEHGCGEGDD